MDKSSEANITEAGPTIDQQSTSQQPSHSAIADKDQLVIIQKAKDQKKISSSKPKEPNVAASTSSMTTRSNSKKAAKTSRLPLDVISRRSTSFFGSANSLYTTVSAKARKAILESKLKAEKEINAMKQKQAAARHAFELEQIAYLQKLQQEEFQSQRFYEKQEMRFNQKLAEAKLGAELNETIAEISADNDNIALEDCGANHNKPNPAVIPKSKTLLPQTDSAEFNAEADNVKFNTDNVEFCTGAANVNFDTDNAMNDNVVLTSSATLSNVHEVSLVSSVGLVRKCLTTAYSQVNPNCSIQNMSYDVSQSPFLLTSSLSFSHSANPVCSNVSFTPSPQMKVTTPNLLQGVAPNVIVNQPPVLDLKPPIFDGNPINYCSFIDAFDTILLVLDMP